MKATPPPTLPTLRSSRFHYTRILYSTFVRMVDGYDETLREQFHSDPFSPSLPLTHDYSHTLSHSLSLFHHTTL